MKPDFGIFEPVFQTGHGYLALLHLGGDGASQAVAAVRACCRVTSDPHLDICRLLTDSNWRPHLVAAVAAFISGYHSETVRLLWHCLDTGSWVTPQIGATLFVIDPDFSAQTRSRLEAGCPLDASDLISMSPLERHSAAGPGGAVHRSAKTARTLMRLVPMISPYQTWIDGLRDSTDLQSLLSQDIDESDSIAERWLDRMTTITEATEQ
jgi:hypothetical protein